jgi:hypothetical protein
MFAVELGESLNFRRKIQQLADNFALKTSFMALHCKVRDKYNAGLTPYFFDASIVG